MQKQWHRILYNMTFFLIIILIGMFLGIILHGNTKSKNPYIYSGSVSDTEWSTVFVSTLSVVNEYVEIVSDAFNEKKCDIHIVDSNDVVIEQFSLLPGQSKELLIEECDHYYIQCKTAAMVENYQIAVLTKHQNNLDYIAECFGEIFDSISPWFDFDIREHDDQMQGTNVKAN